MKHLLFAAALTAAFAAPALAKTVIERAPTDTVICSTPDDMLDVMRAKAVDKAQSSQQSVPTAARFDQTMNTKQEAHVCTSLPPRTWAFVSSFFQLGRDVFPELVVVSDENGKLYYGDATAWHYVKDYQ